MSPSGQVWNLFFDQPLPELIRLQLIILYYINHIVNIVLAHLRFPFIVIFANFCDMHVAQPFLHNNSNMTQSI